LQEIRISKHETIPKSKFSNIFNKTILNFVFWTIGVCFEICALDL